MAKQDWPTKVRREVYINGPDKYIFLTSEVFVERYGLKWSVPSFAMRNMTHLDFSDDRFNLESLEGPEKGLMHPGLHRRDIVKLNVSRNQLTSVDCLNHMDAKGHPEFRNLVMLNVSRNQLTSVKFALPNLVDLNVGHNQLTSFPDCSELPRLTRFVLAHNEIDGTIVPYTKLKRLHLLDISYNNVSWKPSTFQANIEPFANLHMEELYLSPNPFANYFREYQFLTASMLRELKVLDGFPLSDGLRQEIFHRATMMKADKFDYTTFDLQVETKKQEHTLVHSEVPLPTKIPRFPMMIEALSKMLDSMDARGEGMGAFEKLVLDVENCRPSEREHMMTVRDEDVGENTEALMSWRPMTTFEEKRALSHFADLMQQVMARFESDQNRIMTLLIKLVGSSSGQLARCCCDLFVDWVDSQNEEVSADPAKSEALVKDMLVVAAPGMLGMSESPRLCYEMTFKPESVLDKAETTYWGTPNQISKSADLLQALRSFALDGSWVRESAPHRSLVMGAFLPVICRDSATNRGSDKPLDKWSMYEDFDAFPDQDVKEPEMVHKDNLAMVRIRIMRQMWGGFVLEETDNPDTKKVYFKGHSPEIIRATRRRCPGRTLFIRPAQNIKDDESPQVSHSRAWDVWSGSLDILLVATGDRTNAKICVERFELHKTIITHAKGPNGFIDSWLQLTESVATAYTRLMHLATNLMHAEGQAATIAVDYFVEHDFHIDCWARLRKRLEGRSPEDLVEEKGRTKVGTCLVAALVEVVYTMALHPGLKSERVMLDTKEVGTQSFITLLQVAGHTGRQDPMLLCAALEATYMFLESDVTRDDVISNVVHTLHSSSVLLPYIQGPMIEDTENARYHNLWRECTVVYSKDGAELENEPVSEWKKRVPLIRELSHPIMFRVLIDIIRLFELYSRKESADLTNQMRSMTAMLDRRGREDILLNPTTGLVTCTDFNVKKQCIVVLTHVVANNAAQIKVEEMRWILKFVTPRMINFGKEALFVTEAVRFITLMMKLQNGLGRSFRREMGRNAIVSSFDVLTVVAADMARNRDVKLELCRAIAVMLNSISSVNVSQDLKDFLRLTDIVKKYMKVLQLQDKEGENNCLADLMLTWTTRDVFQVLVPLAFGDLVSVRGMARYCAVIRLADVLVGKSDCNRNTGEPCPLTDETLCWRGLNAMKTSIIKKFDGEKNDWQAQQRTFMQRGGLDDLLHAGTIFFASTDPVEGGSTERDVRHDFQDATRLIQDQLIISQQRLQRFISDEQEEEHMIDDATVEPPTSMQMAVPQEQENASTRAKLDAEIFDGKALEEVVEQQLLLRLTNLNETAMYIFHKNLKQQSSSGLSSLKLLAEIFVKYFCWNRGIARAQHELYPGDMRTILKTPNLYYHQAKLRTEERICKSDQNYSFQTQTTGDPHELYQQACRAHAVLKGILASPLDGANARTLAWAAKVEDTPLDPVSTGLVHVISLFEGVVFDPGLRTVADIQRQMRIRGVNDASTIMDVSQLIIEFKSVQKLVEAYGELKKFAKLSIVELRNFFPIPDEMGERMIRARVQIVAESMSHICELKLVVHPDRSTSFRGAQQMLLNDTMRCLKDECSDGSWSVDFTEEVAMWLIHHMKDRSISHGDIVYMLIDSMYIQAHESRVSAQRSCSPLQRSFMLVVRDPPHIRRQGHEFKTKDGMIIKTHRAHGRIRAGETMHIQSRFSDCWLDSSISGIVHCHTTTLETGETNVNFGIKQIDPAQGDGHHTHVFGEDSDCFNTGDTIKIKTDKGQRFLTAVDLEAAKGSWLSAKSTWRQIRMFRESKHGTNQQIQVVRVGSLQILLDLIDRGTVNVLVDADTRSVEEQVYQVLLESFMEQGSSPTTDRDRFTLSNWHVVAQWQAGKAHSEAESPTKKRHRYRCHIAALVRCIYALLMVPCDAGTRVTTLDVLWGTIEKGTMALPHILTMVLAVQRTPAGGLNLTDAWLSAKMLKVMCIFLAVAPAANMYVQKQGISTQANVNNFADFQHFSSARCRFLDYQRQRAMVTNLCASYLHTMASHVLEGRLCMARLQPLSRKEVVLLREFAACVHKLARSHMVTQLRVIPYEDGAGTPLSELEAALSNDEASRSRLFADIITGCIKNVLVQSFLYALHWEALAFQSLGFSGKRDEIRLMTSLANWTIVALTTTMYLLSASPATDCNYEVCEAISIAMSSGVQLVPRTRINGFLLDRAVDGLRQVVEHALRNLAIKQFQSSSTSRHARATDKGHSKSVPKGTERVVSIGIAWIATCGRTKMVRRIVAGTSRHNLVFCSFPDTAHPAEIHIGNLVVEEVRPLERLKLALHCPRMRQFLGLWWGAPVHLLPRSSAASPDPALTPERQILIFECSQRKRFLVESLQAVVRHRKVAEVTRNASLKSFVGVPGLQVKNDVLNLMSESCSYDKLLRNGLLHAMFIRPERGDGHPEVLVLTTDSIGLFSLEDLVSRFAKNDDDDEYYLEEGEPVVVEESDSDSDELPDFCEKHPLDCEALTKLRNSPWPLNELKGVWFPKDEDPMVQLKFAHDIEIRFFREVDRQRFREYLACALAAGQGAEKAIEWSVVPSNAKDIAPVKKKVLSRKQQVDHTGVGIVSI